MGADVLDAVTQFHANGLAGACLDLVDGEVGFRIAPALDAFEQGAAFVDGAGLACGEHVVEVQVSVAERRGDELAAEIHGFHAGHVVALRGKACGEAFADGGETAVFDEDVLERGGLG